MFHRTMEFGVLAVVLVAAAAWTAPARDYQGTVVSVDAPKHKLQTMNDQEEEAEFNVAESCEIMLDDKEAALKDLVEGTTVTITIKKLKGKQIAVKIVARSAE